MKSNKPTFFLPFFLCLLPLYLSAQQAATDTGFIKHAGKVLNELTAKQPVEKAYLHFDKPGYNAGDNIWFKAYLTSGGLHQLSTISGVLNVELISSGGTLYQLLKLPIAAGIGHGDFYLPDTLSAGHYHIRAYTNYMRNGDAAYFFDKDIFIANNKETANQINRAIKSIKNNTQAKASLSLAQTTDVQFFPESGRLVNGVNSEIAFKVVGMDGLGKEVSGLVIDNSGAEITRFSSFHKGMGSFNLFPAAGKTYKATLTFADGSNKEISLPAAANSGYVLSLYNQAENPDVPFRVSIDAGQAADSTLVLIAQSSGYVCYATIVKVKGSIISGKVPKADFPTGVAQFTLFTTNGEPLCERLAFINNNDALKIALSDSTAGQSTNVRLNVKDADGLPIIGSFSAAVVDCKIATDKELAENDNILSYILLTSDIKGKIEAPGYYFNNENDSTRAALDLLMLTQGYRSFEWKKALNNPMPQFAYSPEIGLTVSGHLLNAYGKNIAGGHVTILNIQNNLILDTVSDTHGQFAFHHLFFADSLQFAVRAMAANGNDNVQVKIDKPEQLPAPVTPFFSYRDMDTVMLLQGLIKAGTQDEPPLKSNTKMLKPVIIKDIYKNTHGASPYSANLNGPGSAEYILTSKDLENLGANLLDIIPGKIPGVRVDRRFHVLVSARSIGGSSDPKHSGMLIILDGTYYSADLGTINPSDIASIEVLLSAANTTIYGSRGGNGVVVITTKHGGDDDSARPTGSTTITPQGFYKARAFYSPKYSAPKNNSTLAEVAGTIFWAPGLVTDKSGNASLSYPAAGNKKTYRVIVEGIGINGKLGYGVLCYNTL